MLGNDVVDLRDPEALEGAQHPRFDTRVFDSEERALVAASADPARARWTLWAAKEAAFKAARRLRPRLGFAPRRWRVDPRAGLVVGEGVRLNLRLVAVEGGVHAVVAAAAETGRRLVAAEPLARGADPGRAARALALRCLARRLGAAPDELAVARGADRLPRLLRRGRPAPVLLSLSHHGGLVAFAAELPA